MTEKSTPLKRGLLVLAVAAAGGLAYFTGAFEALTSERLETAFRDLGVWGPVLYVVLFACLEAFFVPGIIFVIPGGLVWDWPTLFVMSLLGASGAAVVGFGFSRTIGREFVEKRLSKRASAYDEALSRNGVRTVISLRLIFFIAPWVNWLLGLSKVRFRDFLLGTVIGFTPVMIAFTWAGSRGLELLFERPLLGLSVTAVCVGAMFFWGRAFHRRIQADLSSTSTSL
jgi:uncharacterized membrane protein YdjX (TVP38/TMEM64 family)